MTNNFIEIIECNICNVIFESYDDLQQHVESYHSELLPDLGDKK